MKKLLVVFVMAMFLVASFSQASYANDRHGYRNHNQHYNQPPRHYQQPRYHYCQPRRQVVNHYYPQRHHVVHHHHNNRRSGDAALAVLGGIVAIATLGAIMTPPQPRYTQYEYEREMQYRQYDDCMRHRGYYDDCRIYLPR
jgi:hypothetical protein